MDSFRFRDMVAAVARFPDAPSADAGYSEGWRDACRSVMERLDGALRAIATTEVVITMNARTLAGLAMDHSLNKQVAVADPVDVDDTLTGLSAPGQIVVLRPNQAAAYLPPHGGRPGAGDGFEIPRGENPLQLSRGDLLPGSMMEHTDADRYRWMRASWLDGIETGEDSEMQLAIAAVYTEDEMDAAIDAELRKPENAHLLQAEPSRPACLPNVQPKGPGIEVSVGRMSESDGRVTWMVMLHRHGDQTPLNGHQVYSSHIEGRAQYEAAALRHFLGQGPEPDILDFDTDGAAPSPAPVHLSDEHVSAACRAHLGALLDGASTADDAMRVALSVPASAVAHGEPVAWAVYWGIGKMRMNSVHQERETAEGVASGIKSVTEVRPLYALGDAQVTHSHRWDDVGERCVKCGDKDWMGGPCSVPDSPPKPIGVEVVGVVRDLGGDEDPTVEWLLEGGLHAVAEGGGEAYLMVSHEPITDDDGHGEVYRTSDVPVQHTAAPEPIRCPERLKNGGTCPHHNLQCGWPACNKEKA